MNFKNTPNIQEVEEHSVQQPHIHQNDVGPSVSETFTDVSLQLP